MSLRTKGDLFGFSIKREKIAGVFDTTDNPVIYGGIPLQISNDDTVEFQEIPEERSLTYGDINYTAYNYGYTATVRVFPETLKTWMELAGVTTKVDESADNASVNTFSTRFTTGITGGIYTSKIYLGCRVVGLTVKAEGFGRMLEVVIKVVARYAVYASSANPSSFKYPDRTTGNIKTESFPIASKPEGAPMTYRMEPKLAWVSSNEVNWPAHVKSWTYSVERSVTKTPGIIYALDGTKAQGKKIVTGCLDAISQDVKLTYSANIPYADDFWSKVKIEGFTNVKIAPNFLDPAVMNGTYTLMNCHIEGGLITNVQTTSDETVMFHAGGVAIVV